jgi:hypothetical protein
LKSWILFLRDRKARQQADKAQRELEASAAALAGHQLPWVRRRCQTSGGGKPPVITGVQGHLKNIDTNTKATANNTKKVGPGDIVFKNLPRALALRGPIRRRGLFRNLCRACLLLRPAAFCRYRRRRRGDVCAGRCGVGCCAVLPAGL